MNKCLISLAAVAAMVVSANGQVLQRKASIVGGGRSDRGVCTIEVVVDDGAEVDIRGDNATLRNLSGSAPQWRRFECTSVMPRNPSEFAFTGVDGRGRQELVRDPRNGGTAVVRIQDHDGGSEGYTFRIAWGGDDRNDRNSQDRHGFEGRRNGERLSTANAVQVCQDSIRQQAWDRFHERNIAFRGTAMDNNPGRNDWVTGLLDVRRGFQADETYRFTCSVNFDNGEVRSAEIEQKDQGRYGPRYGDGSERGSRQAMDACQRSVEERVQRDGYRHVDFLSINTDNRPGRNDSIVGVLRADAARRSESFNFTCAVDLRSGAVRSVDVRRR